jgi:hypothetical protein
LVAVAGSRFDLRWPGGQRVITQPYANHNGGNLAFGPDGYLYIGLGDGGSGNDPQNTAQSPMTLLGKMLRIDVNVADSDQNGYRVPPTNPFAGRTDVRPEIWAFGYRNPWRYSFDDLGPGATGALIVGDVGQGAKEEINYEPAGRGGRNYGWRIREGTIATPGVQPTTPAYLPLTSPMADYGREIGGAVTGGYVYRGGALPPFYRGRYFVADSSSGRAFSVGLAIGPGGEATVAGALEHTDEIDNPGTIVSFGRGLDGELYFASFNGRIYKIVSAGPSAPSPPPAPTNLNVVVNGSTVILSWQPGAGGSVTGYRIEAGSAAGAANLLVMDVGPTPAVTGEVPDGHYYVRVRALSPGGTSAASNEIAVSVGCASPPVAPSSFTAQVAGQFVTLAWGVSVGATSYVVEAGSSAGQSDLAVIPTTTSGLAGLVPSGTYHARVRALNACGASAPSIERVVVVP